MEPHSQAGVPSRQQDRLALLGGEGNLVTEGIHCVGQALLDRPGNHLLPDKLQVLLPTALKLGREHVSPQECRLEVNRMVCGQSSGRTEHAKLRIGLHAVPRLHLHGGDPLGPECRQAPGRLTDQILLGGLPSGPHGGSDPSALPGDLLVAGPPEACLELA